jgi:hypothetical protein
MYPLFDLVLIVLLGVVELGRAFIHTTNGLERSGQVNEFFFVAACDPQISHINADSLRFHLG